MGFFVLGVNHKECPVAVREKLHFTASLIDEALGEVRENQAISELVILSTCNRVEFYGHADSVLDSKNYLLDLIERKCPVKREDLLPYLYDYEEKEAVHHLFRVASGLDSLVVGENEILGQVRDAFRMANHAQSVHSLLYRLLEKALKVGKDVRAQTKINEGAVSIPSVAVELAQKIFGRLAGERVMVLGTGEMSILTLKNLKDSGADIVYVVSRDRVYGEKIAVDFDAEWVDYHGWPDLMGRVDILIASTAAPHPVVRYDQIKAVMGARHRKPLFLIDIAVPRNIEPHINALDDVYLYNIDDLKGVSAANLKLRRREIEAAEALVEEAVHHFNGWLQQLASRPILERYEKFLNETIEEELNRLERETGMNKEMKEKFRERLRAKLLYPPLEKIKEASANGGVVRYMEALESLFKLDETSRQKSQ